MNKDVKSLFNWLEEGVDEKEVDATMEWLKDSGMLNKKGIVFCYEIWKHTWHSQENKKESNK